MNPEHSHSLPVQARITAEKEHGLVGVAKWCEAECAKRFPAFNRRQSITWGQKAPSCADPPDPGERGEKLGKLLVVRRRRRCRRVAWGLGRTGC